MPGPDESAARAPPSALIGGRYRLGEVLGKGGMGVVYRASQESLSRPVAIKLLIPALAQDVEAVARFRAEAERAGRLAHPHIVQILDFGREPSGELWIAMELLEGESLAARIERAPLTEAEVVRVALETLAALEAAHGAHLVHRDLKPDNVFLSHVPGIGVSVKVLDFGIAKLLEAEGAGKLTATGMLIGTPLYMAPEQARGEEVDTRADLYSLGALLYEALCQRPPLAAKTYPALLVAVMTESPRPIEELRPEITPALAQVIRRAMAKDPGARFQSAAEMAASLRQVRPSASSPTYRASDPSSTIGTAPTMATPMPLVQPAPATRAHEPPRRSVAPTLWIAGLIVAALGGGLIALALPRLLTPPVPPPTALTPAPEPVRAMAPMSAAPAPDADREAAPAVVAPSDPEPSAPTHDATPARAPRTDRPSRSESAGASTPRGHTTPGVHYAPRVHYSGGTFAGMPRSVRDEIDAVDWSSCWPSDVPPPTSSRGRAFVVDVASDGRVTDVAPATPLSREPAAFAACARRRMLAIRFPAPTAAAPVQIRVVLGID